MKAVLSSESVRGLSSAGDFTRWAIFSEPKSTSMMEWPSASSFEAKALSPRRMRVICSSTSPLIRVPSASSRVLRDLIFCLPSHQKTTW
jgi:hypothetical protein